MPPKRELHILQVEDDPDDIFLFQRALRHVESPCVVHTVKDGEQAVQFLLREGEFATRPEQHQPSLILLDLKLPRKNGFEFLEWVKTEPRLRLIPVVVYTSSSQLSDIHRAYRLGANSYIVKTADFQKMEENVKVLLSYWTSFCECVTPSP